LNERIESFLNHPWAELSVRWLLGGAFVVASVHKIADPAGFAKIVYGYQLVPHAIINLIAIVLPFLELISGAALMAGIYPRSAALIIEVLLSVFIVGISINLVRGHQFDCGCFAMGAADRPSAAGLLLVRDLVFLAGGSYVLGYGGSPKWCLWHPTTG